MAIDLTAKKCLVIDDFADMRSMLKSMLTAYGVTSIDTAANGKDAVKQMTRNRYDVVLCDYNLGEGKDGQQVLEEAKDKGLLPYSTAFLMITAENTMYMVMGAVEYQPDDYLSKPFNKDSLRTRLEKIIGKKNDLEPIDKLLKKERFADAIALCDERIEQKPRNLSEVQKLKTDILLKTGDYDEAEKVFDGILSKRNVPWAMLGLGKIRYFTMRYMEARKIFEKIIEENRNNVEAYDWLAKTMLELGDTEQAKGVLGEAAAISPKAIMRHMQLGSIALKTNDLVTAERSYKKAVNIGGDSIYQTPANYINLAKVMVDTGSGQEAFRVLKKLRSDYSKDEEAGLYASITESVLYKKMGKESEAHDAYAAALKTFGSLNKKMPKEVTLEMANACLVNGDQEKGSEILQDLIKNNHEDDQLINNVQGIFDAVGLGNQGREMINATTQEVTELNNTGVQLAREGKLDEAISFFEKAVNNLPDNKTINLNMVNVLLTYMKANGKRDKYMYKVRQHLQRVGDADPTNENYRKLHHAYEKMAAS